MMPTNYMQLLGGTPQVQAMGVTGDPRSAIGGQGQLYGAPEGRGRQVPMGGPGTGMNWLQQMSQQRQVPMGAPGMHPIIQVLHGLLGQGHQGGMGGLPVGNPVNPQTQMFLHYLSQVLGQR